MSPVAGVVSCHDAAFPDTIERPLSRGGKTMNTLFEEEIRGHHSMRDHLLTIVSDSDLAYRLPGQNPTLGDLLVEMGEIEGVYTHSFDTFTVDWTYRWLAPPRSITIGSLQAWFAAHDEALNTALSRFTEEEVHVDQIDRGHGFIASPFVQVQIYREAIYIFYGKLSVYLKALERDAGEEWTMWVG
jgi:hypothetical protein